MPPTLSADKGSPKPPKVPQKRPKGLPKDPKKLPRDLPGDPKEGPRAGQEAPRDPRGHPKASKMTPRGRSRKGPLKKTPKQRNFCSKNDVFSMKNAINTRVWHMAPRESQSGN